MHDDADAEIFSDALVLAESVIGEPGSRTPRADPLTSGAMAFPSEVIAVLRSERWSDQAFSEDVVGVRAYRRLPKIGVRTFGDLAAMWASRFLALQGVGPGTLTDLRTRIADYLQVSAAIPQADKLSGLPTAIHRHIRSEAPSSLGREVERIQEAHGPSCSCPYVVTLDSVVLPAAVRAQVVAKLTAVSTPTLWQLARLAKSLDPATLRSVSAAVAGVRTAKCRTSGLAAPETPGVPWRQRVYPGVFAVEDRWPDEVNPDEWARQYDVRSDSGDEAPIFNDEYRRTQGAYAAKAWLWKTHIEPEEPLDLGVWGYDEIIRALWLLRSTEGYPWEARVDQIGRIAASARQPFSEARRFIRYVDECDRGLIAIDPGVERVLRSTSTADIKRLGARVRMQDQIADLPESGVNSGDLRADEDRNDTRMESHEGGGTPAMDDGQPNPLAELRNLLPGGKWVLGKAHIVHSPTELDTELLPRLRDGDPTLVILSGNAGDGKTAFIEDVLEDAGIKKPDQVGEVKPKVDNELEVSLNGKPYRVVLDGSEDTSTKTNARLLHDALDAFRGDERVFPEVGTLIAVNKGRLLSFLEAEQASFGYLWNLARRRYANGELIGDDGYLLVDLNDRTVVGPDLDGSLWGSIIQKLLAWDGWKGCDSCPANAACPASFNATALRLDHVRQRLWEVFTLIDLDDRLHVTARHVVTRLASVVTGGLRCPDVRLTVTNGGSFPERAYFYTAAFLGRVDETTAEEAALNEIAAAYDPAETSVPQRDRELGAAIASGSVRPVIPTLPGEPDSDIASIEGLAAELARRTVDESTADYRLEYRQAHLEVMARLLRRRYFLGGATDVAPVRALSEFNGLSVTQDSGLTDRLLRSLNASLGVTRAGQDLVVPKDYSRGLAGSGIALKVPASNFQVSSGTGLGTTFNASRYTRSWPRSVLLEATDDGVVVATLSIPLLMLEILGRADMGFRPTSRTERNYLVRVATFYRRLAEHRWQTPLDYVLYERGRVRAGMRFAEAGIQFWGV